MATLGEVQDSIDLLTVEVTAIKRTRRRTRKQ